MLQCEMCMQWFHAKDVEALKPEDAFVPFQRNYRFVCRICAGGREQLEFVTNTWSSVCLTSLYNLLLSEKGESSGASQSTAQSTSQSTAQSTVSLSGQSISQRAVKVSEIREWILHRWESSLTRGRNLQQLTENKAIEKSLFSSGNTSLWSISDDRSEVALRTVQLPKLQLKPFAIATTVSSSDMPAKPKSNSKRERDGASSAKRKKGDKAKQPAAPVSTAPSVNEIKLPDKYRLLPAPRLDPLAAAQDGSLVLLSRIARAPQITLRE